MSVRYSCPDCGTTLRGRPILAFRRPPAEVECEECHRVLKVPFSYRLFWCYQLAISTLFLPFSIWMLSGDVEKLGNVSTWINDLGAGLFSAIFFGVFVALPLTFVLRPAPRRG